MTGVENNASEFDFALAYSLPVDVNQMAIDVGIVNYNFQTMEHMIQMGKQLAFNQQQELYLSATILSFDKISFHQLAFLEIFKS